MSLDEWWHIIELARSTVDDADEPDAVVDEVRLILSERDPEEIAALAQPLWDLLAMSYNWELWAAAYLINGGASDDGFEYFRGWLITQGREVFEDAVDDPDSLAGVAAVRRAAEEGEDLECEDILHVVHAAYEDLTGEELPAGAYTVEYPDLGPDWDFDDDEEMAAHLPRLSALYLEDE
jgi:hypothetical protein